MQKYGATPEQAAGGSPDVAWLLAGDGGEAHLYSAGDRLSVGIEALPGREHNDLVFWIESRHAVVAGDTLVDFGRGLEIPRECCGRALRASRSSKGCSRFLPCPSMSFSPRTAHQQIVQRSTARSLDSGTLPPQSGLLRVP